MSDPSIDRVAMRERPDGTPVMIQSWERLLFLHWQMPVGALRRLVPDRLTIDTYDGRAWIGITPFTVYHARPPFLPPVPWISDFHELNVRTYVHYNGIPGVWFFSLDAASLAAVLGARAFFHLPYYHAEMSRRQHGSTIDYSSVRSDDSPATFRASWKIGEHMPSAQPDSLEFFLIERYCLYTVDNGGALYRSRIHHRPWLLQKAELLSIETTMIEVQGLPTPTGTPLLHYSHDGVQAEIWPIEKV